VADAARESDVGAPAEGMRAELERVRAEAAEQLARAHERAREASEALLKLESHRAEELNRLHAAERDYEAAWAAYVQAHDVIHQMQATRIWRLASVWWRLKARVFGR
jgi:chromosome segregation ATPase